MAKDKKKLNKNSVEKRRIQTLLTAAYGSDYAETPVSVHRFLADSDFLGESTRAGKAVYPIWHRVLTDLSNMPEKNLPIFTGAIGTGKTTAAVIGIAYVMMNILCLKSPWEFFNKTEAGKMAIVFFNLTQSLGGSRGFGLLQSYLLQSPWFKDHGQVVGSGMNPRIDFPIFEYVSGSPYAKGFGVQGHDIIAALMDEVDSPSESDKQRVRVLQAFETAYRRFENRFVIRSQIDDRRISIGKFFLVASKQEQLSFLNTFVTKMKNSPNVYIVDIPIWEAREAAEYCGVRFPVMVGDLYTPSAVLGREIDGTFESNTEAVTSAIQKGFKVIQVPIEYVEAFQRDTIGALRDYAGISVAGMRKSKLFPSEKLIVDCYDPAKRDPVSMLTIEVGLNDDINFAEYLDFSAIRIPRSYPRYIHVDVAYSGDGDALGLAMSCISGWQDRAVEDLEDGGSMRVEKLPVVETDFAMRIKGRPGDKIPLNKIRKFIVDLKKVYGFNIVLATFDWFSEDSIQTLNRIGIKSEKLSLDRNPQIYRSFRDLVHDKRWCCHRNEYLHFELINLEDDLDKNKVDHPDEVVDIVILEDGGTRDVVLKGSKDVCFTKDVKIALLDGRFLTIPEIENEVKKGKLLYTYSVDLDSKKVVAGKIINAFQSGETDRLIEVTLDNNEVIVCTLDHPFIAKNGKNVLAKNLEVGTSLLPLYTREAWEGYRIVKNPFSGKNHYEHRLFSGFLDKGLSCNKFVVHHKWDTEKETFDSLNNSPSMLQIMAISEHKKLHGSHPSSAEKMKKMQKRAQEIMATPEWKEKQARVLRRSIKLRAKRGDCKRSNWMNRLKKNGINPMDDDRVRKNQENATNGRRGIPSWCSGLTKETDKRIQVLAEAGSKTKREKNALLRQQKMSYFICPNCKKEYQDTNRCFVKHHIAACKRDSKFLYDVVCRYCEEKFSKISFGKFRSHLGNCAIKVKKSLNHKVINVKFVNKNEKIYDLTIEKYHNFALAAGVFVHNSDSVVGSVENAIKGANVPVSKEFIEGIKKISSQVKKVDPIRSLLTIDEVKPFTKIKQEDSPPKRTAEQFKNLFKRSQRNL